MKNIIQCLHGCIQGSRTILARDIIAVILNLIDKKIIKMELYQNLSKKEKYTYILTRNLEAENKMDDIEEYVYNWLFRTDENVSLVSRLEEMPKEKEANQKFKRLNKMVEEELSKKGANKAKVPSILRGFNIFLFVLSLVVIFKHVMFNGFQIYNGSVSNEMIFVYGLLAISFFPAIIGLLYIPMNLLIIVRHRINRTVQKVTGQMVATTTISLIVLFSIIVILTAIFVNEKYLIADEILICIGAILIFTDNLMLKNDAIMIEDYSRLNALKDKIEQYTLMEERDIEQVTLWEKYLSYSVSFGIASKIIKRIKGLNLDNDLEILIDNDILTGYIMSDYAIFYASASLDSRFVKAYKNVTDSINDTIGNFSGGRRRRIFRRRRLLRWRRKPEEVEEPSSI